VGSWPTAATIVNRAAAQLKLLSVPAAAAPDPFASTDPNFIQLCDLLNTVGDEINNASPEGGWPQLRKEYTTTTILGQSTYNLPSDFHEMVDQSGWNRSARLPLIGPLSPQEWQYLKARSLGMYISIVFRLNSPMTFDVNPGAAVPGGIVIAFEYISDWFTQQSGQPSPNQVAPTVGTDVLYYDDELLISALKLKWAAENGWDTSALEPAYEAKLEHCKGKATGAPTLNLVGPASAVDRFIDNANLPLTGFGQ
jgi:hypothetical protein